MLDMEPSVGWVTIEQRLAVTTNPRHRRMLEVIIDHAKAEYEGDVEGLMNTLAPNPRYHLWGGGAGAGPKSFEAVRAYYTDFVASGAGYFESRKDRIVVDDDNVVTESYYRGLMPGRLAQARGYQIDDLDAHYMAKGMMVIFWSFDEEVRLTGEDSYTAGKFALEKVPSDQLPPRYLEMLEKVGAGAR